MLEQTVQVINPLTSLIFIFSSNTRIWENFTVLFIRFLIILHTFHQHSQLPSSSLKSQLPPPHSQVYLTPYPIPDFTSTHLLIPNYLPSFSPFPTTSFPSLHSQLPPFLLSLLNYLPSFFPFPTTSFPSLHSQLPPFLLSIPNYLPSFFLFIPNYLLSFSPFSTASLPSPHSQLPLLHVASFGQACMK